MTAQPTERDRERSAEVLRRIAVGLESTTVSIVAQALADERERARAPFLALAEELDGEHAAIYRDLLEHYGVRFRWDVADRIRAAAQEVGQ